jgi:hypothetical protein
MRRWWMAAAGALVVAAALAWTAVEVIRPAGGCGCALPPQLDHVDATAYRWLAAVREGDAATAWALLTPDAQRRHGDVDRFRAELPALASRFGDSTGRWQVVDERTQGAGTPSEVFLVRVTSRDGVAAATGGLVIHSRATSDDPGRIDPDLGEPLQITAADPATPLTLPGRVRVANPDGRLLDFLAVPLADPPVQARLDVAPVRDLGDGVYDIAGTGHRDLSGAGLVIAVVHRPDGRRAFGAVPVSFGEPRG